MIICANPSAQFETFKTEIEDAVLRVMRSNRFILGKEVELIESEFSDYIGTKEAIGVANGTDALELAIRSLGITLGDEIITVSHTAVATIAAIEAAGATPVLVDIEPNYYTINPQQLDDVLTSKTRAVIAVHLYGLPANLDAIQKFCAQNEISLIEDVSQAHGSSWKGKKAGSFGDIACFSCYPTKNLGALGDAGLITTNDSHLAGRIKALREYGWVKHRYISELQGRNSRLDEIQAAILRIKLRNLDESNSKRIAIANYYISQLSSCTDIFLPSERKDSDHVYHLFVIQTNRRDQLIEYLRKKDIIAGIHYPVPVHLQKAYKDRIRCHSDMKTTESISNKIISLPIYPELDEKSQNIIVSTVKDFFKT